MKKYYVLIAVLIVCLSCSVKKVEIIFPVKNNEDSIIKQLEFDLSNKKIFSEIYTEGFPEEFYSAIFTQSRLDELNIAFNDIIEDFKIKFKDKNLYSIDKNINAIYLNKKEVKKYFVEIDFLNVLRDWFVLHNGQRIPMTMIAEFHDSLLPKDVFYNNEAVYKIVLNFKPFEIKNNEKIIIDLLQKYEKKYENRFRYYLIL